MSICFLNSLPNSKYSNLLIIAAFPNCPFSGQISSLVKNSYLPIFSDNKAEIIAVNCIELCFAPCCYQLF